MGSHVHRALGAAFLLSLAGAAAAQPVDLAKMFGAREAISGVRLSPDGTRISYITPLAKGGSALMVADVTSGASKAVLRNTDQLLRLNGCDWAKPERLVCGIYGIADIGVADVSFTRLLAIDPKGGNVKVIGQRSNSRSLGLNQYSGGIISWLPDDPQNVLMQMEQSAEVTIGTRLANKEEGLTASLVDLGTGRQRKVESARREVVDVHADAGGGVRLMTKIDETTSGRLGRTQSYFYRTKSSRE